MATGVVAAARLSWGPQDRRVRVVVGVLLGLFAFYAGTFLGLTVHRLAGGPAGDFFALWSTAQIAAADPATAYDAVRMHAAQLAQGMDPRIDYPFPYPPFFLFALWPLGRLPFGAAYIIAIGGTLLLYVWATVGRRWRSPLTLAALLAPTTTIAIVAGQAAFLASALLIGGVRLAGRRPAMAGVLLGAASFKPQLLLIAPVVLIATRNWRAIAAATMTVAALVAASAAVHGPSVWAAWAGSLGPYASEFAAAAGGRLGHLMPTVRQAAIELGASATAATAAQAAAAIAAAWAAARCARLTADPPAAAAVLVATFLATPHALVYDLPPVATAALWLIAERWQAQAALMTGAALVLIAALLAPVAIVAGSAGPPLAVAAMALLLALAVRHCRDSAAAAPPQSAIADSGGRGLF